jgi:hypothetical protein
VLLQSPRLATIVSKQGFVSASLGMVGAAAPAGTAAGGAARAAGAATGTSGGVYTPASRAQALSR